MIDRLDQVFDEMKLRGMRLDSVAVDVDDWNMAKAGDEDAKERLKQSVIGLELYHHAMRVEDDQIVVSLLDLDDVVSGLCVTIGKMY